MNGVPGIALDDSGRQLEACRGIARRAARVPDIVVGWLFYVRRWSAPAPPRADLALPNFVVGGRRAKRPFADNPVGFIYGTAGLSERAGELILENISANVGPGRQTVFTVGLWCFILVCQLIGMGAPLRGRGTQ